MTEEIAYEQSQQQKIDRCEMCQFREGEECGIDKTTCIKITFCGFSASNQET